MDIQETKEAMTMKKVYLIPIAVIVVVAFLLLIPDTSVNNLNEVIPHFYDVNNNEITYSNPLSFVNLGSTTIANANYMILEVKVTNTGNINAQIDVNPQDLSPTALQNAWPSMSPFTLTPGQSKSILTNQIPLQPLEGASHLFTVKVTASSLFPGYTDVIQVASYTTLEVYADPVLNITVTTQPPIVHAKEVVSDPLTIGSDGLFGGLILSSYDTVNKRITDGVRKTFTIPGEVNLANYNKATLQVYGGVQYQPNYADASYIVQNADVKINGISTYSNAIRFHNFVNVSTLDGWRNITDTNILPILTNGDNELQIYLTYDITNSCMSGCPPNANNLNLYGFAYTSDNSNADLDSSAWDYYANAWKPYTKAMNARIILET